MNATTSLFDHPGPRTRRRLRFWSAGSTLVLAAGAFAIVRLLQRKGQFAPDLWTPLLDPRDQNFSLFWSFLGGGIANAVQMAAVALVLSTLAGIAFAMLVLISGKWLSRTILGVIELLRAIPVVLLIFFVAIVLPRYGAPLPVLWYMVIAIAAHNAAVIAVITRAGVAALPRGQTEAACALGLSRTQTLTHLLLPQALRLMLPALITQLILIVKESTLGFIVSFPDLLRRGQIAVEVLDNPIQTYLLIAVIFILTNYALSQLANRLGRAPHSNTARRKRIAKTAKPQTVLSTTMHQPRHLTSMAASPSSSQPSKSVH